MELSYKLRGYEENKGNVHGLSKVFFTCHPDDFELYSDMIISDIHKTQNCAVFYTENMNAELSASDFEDFKNTAQLLVIPVTPQFLYKFNRAKDIELPFAIKNHIPVLPIMVIAGLENEFNRICGDLQCLNRIDSSDSTEIPYEEKLKEYLDNILIGDELKSKIRDAFDAYIFISYRKKDRHYAQELMRLIHKNELCRDIAFWYDEYLIPGESFNDAILDAIKKSNLFTLVVTPNILEMPNGKPNYVMEHEYKDAQKFGKSILPAELQPTDKDKLGEYYPNIPDSVDANDEFALSESLTEQLKRLAIEENDNDAQHLFFIGLAYYSGIDVETDKNRGVELFEKSAKLGCAEAFEKLISIYHGDEGGVANYEKATYWSEQYLEYNKSLFGEAHQNTFSAMIKLAVMYYDARRLDDALTLGKKASALCKENLGDEHSTTLDALFVLVNIFWDKNLRDDSITLANEILKLREKILGLEHPDTLESMTFLANCYFDMGRESEALTLCEKVFSIDKRIFGEEHPRTLVAMGNLASSYDAKGSLSKALTMREKAFETAKKVLGEKHPKTLGMMNNLAESYDALEMDEECLNLREECLYLRKTLYGEMYPETHTSMLNLANSYEKFGFAEEALLLREQVYEATKLMFGEKHPRTSSSMYNLAVSYILFGRRKEAKALVKKALDIEIATHGAQDPNTLKIKKTLRSLSWFKAIFLQAYALAALRSASEEHPDGLNHNLIIMSDTSGNVDVNEAIAINEKLLSVRECILGKEHSSTLIIMSELAIAYSEAGRFDEALILNKEAFNIRKRLLGEKDSATLGNMSNHARFYFAAGRIEDALNLDERVFSIRKQVLGENHTDTILSMTCLAIDYKKLGRIDDAINMIEKVYIICIENYGEQDSNTIRAKSLLKNWKEQ